MAERKLPCVSVYEVKTKGHDSRNSTVDDDSDVVRIDGAFQKRLNSPKEKKNGGCDS
jgi:hypothetical protein